MPGLYIGSAAPVAGANSGGAMTFLWACQGTVSNSVPRSHAQRLVRMSVNVSLIVGRTRGHMTAMALDVRVAWRGPRGIDVEDGAIHPGFFDTSAVGRVPRPEACPKMKAAGHVSFRIHLCCGADPKGGRTFRGCQGAMSF